MINQNWHCWPCVGLQRECGSQKCGNPKYRRLCQSMPERRVHEGPLDKNHSSWKGDQYNVKVEWENGDEISYEPLHTITAHDSMTCAIYAKERGLLDIDGWKRFRSLAKIAKKMLYMVNQSKFQSYKTCKKYVHGIQIPQGYDHGVRLDKWQSVTKLEMGQLHECNTFHDKRIGTTPGKGFKKIQVHLVFVVKQDGRHKARLCVNGNLTVVLMDSVYSRVVSSKILRTVIYLAELNGLESWATDIDNAYLEAKT